ncbi:MAG: polar amino acid transport system substrate-binding [Planctomycetota bacterium]|nr:MAG: polar amino acid transport system substrate-binding [Planctomycetota bacterium]
MKNLMLAAVAAVAFADVSCGNKSSNTLRVGTETPYIPFEYVEAGEYKGFDMDLMRAVGREMGRPVEFQSAPFDSLVAGLNADKYDAVISCVTITEERKKQDDFSDPYYEAGQIVAVRANETAIKSKEDLKGRKIGGQANTTGLAEANKLGGQVTPYDDINLAFQGLINGQVDAVINDEPVSRRIARSNPAVKVVGEVFTAEQYGIAVKKGNSALLTEINKALKKIRDSGELDKLKEKWITNAK